MTTTRDHHSSLPQMAYISKERAGQVKEKAVAVEAEKVALAALEAGMEVARRRVLEEEKRKEEERKVAALEAKAVIQKQLHEKELRAFVEAEAEAARERSMIDAILSKIHAEDEAEAAQRAKARAEVMAVRHHSRHMATMRCPAAAQGALR